MARELVPDAFVDEKGDMETSLSPLPFLPKNNPPIAEHSAMGGLR